MNSKQLILLPDNEFTMRVDAIRAALTSAGVDGLLISDNANKYYLTGRVYAGYAYISTTLPPMFFVRRPIGLEGDGVIYIRKPEQIADSLGLNIPGVVGLEMGLASYTDIMRLKDVFGQSEAINATPLLKSVRAVKTPLQLEMLRKSGELQERVYRMVPRLYQEGMTDLELQVELEKVSRLEGCLGQFRISGDSMELYMGSILVGENADNPTPYDFAMGGGGIDPSLPVGCNGSTIRPGDSVMVDINGDYTGYMTDMTRTFYLNHISPLASKAHQCSIDICRKLAHDGVPGVEAKSLYETAANMAREAGLEKYFMGHRQKAGFIGHGVGIEINELPVIAPRSRDILRENNVIALEPKFVIPGAGAVGIENTYIVTPTGLVSITSAPEELIDLMA